MLLFVDVIFVIDVCATLAKTLVANRVEVIVKIARITDIIFFIIVSPFFNRRLLFTRGAEKFFKKQVLPFTLGVRTDDVCYYVISFESFALAAFDLVLNFAGSYGNKVGFVNDFVNRRNFTKAVFFINFVN